MRVKKIKEKDLKHMFQVFNNSIASSYLIILKKKKFRLNSSGKIKIGNVSVNEKDLIYDLTHQAVKDTSFNLSSEQRLDVLKELKKTGMPASNIRNTSLKKIYVTGKSNWGELSFSSEEDEEEGYSLFKKKNQV